MSESVLLRVVDEAGLRQWHDVECASFAADHVALPADPIGDIRPALYGEYNSEDVELWVVVDGDRPVASMRVHLPKHDNLTIARMELHVHPDQRRRGHGGLAVERAVTIARDRGRNRLLAGIAAATRLADPSPGEAFARGLGARPMLAEMRRMLDLPTLSASRLAELEAEATAASVGYSTVSWRDRTPPEYIDDMAELNALMSTDPPHGELDLEPERWDAKRYLDREQSIVDRGRQQLVVAARDDSTGQLVAYTNIGVPSGGATVGYQWDTVVRGEHRGHRLGLLVKLANLRCLRSQLPEVRYLNTWNADDNSHMVAINERLGFQRMEGWTDWQLDL